jgi:hypothetical protein
MFNFCAVNIYSAICILAPWNNQHHRLLHIHVQAVLLYNTISQLYDFSSLSRHASVHCLTVQVKTLVDIFQWNARLSQMGVGSMLCTLLKCFKKFCYTGWEAASQQNYSSVLSHCTWAVLWRVSSSLLTAKCCSKLHISIVVTIIVLYLSCLPSLQHRLWPSCYCLCNGNSNKKANNFHICTCIYSSHHQFSTCIM